MFVQPLNGQAQNQNILQMMNDVVVMPAWIQGRVSTKPQVGKKVKGIFEEKASLSEQQNNCQEAIKNFKGRCPKCSKEIRLIDAGISLAKGESGQDFDREDVEEILRLAREGKFQVLVTNENDRLARSRATGMTIREQLKKELGIQIYSLSQPLPLKCFTCYDYYDADTEKITETFSDLKSELDISRIIRNYKIGMPRRIQRGIPPGSLPYGLMKKYRVIGKDSLGNDVLETYYEWDPIKIVVVNRIAKEYMEGIGLWLLCRNLNSEGISSPQGKKWGRSAIMVILKNPAYAGFVRFGWKPVKRGIRKIQPREKWLLCKAQYKAVWENEYYEKIQAEIKRRGTVGGRTILNNSLLIGLLKCGRCGYSMFQTKTRRIFKNGTHYLFRGYSCGSFMHGGACCSNGKKQAIIDNLVIQEILKIANDKTRTAYIEKINGTKIDNRKEQYKLKEMEFKRRLDEFKRIKRAYREGVDTLEEYNKNKEELLPILEQLQKELISLNANANTTVKIDWDKEYKLILSKFLTTSNESNKKIVRQILFRLIDKIEFVKDPLCIKIFYKTKATV